MGRVVDKGELIINLTTARTGFEEVLRVPMTGGDSLKLWLVNNGTGGAGANVRCRPAWEPTSAALANNMSMAETDDTGSITSIAPVVGTPRMVEVYFGDLIQQFWRVYPPYVVVEMDEDYTGGTFTLGHIITELM